MTANITYLPTARGRRIALPGAAARIAGAVQDLREIASEHTFDRDGLLEVAARLARVAEDLQAAEIGTFQ
ncbi:hypothetical protein GAY31_19540 [Azospirillum brasilense]|nr:hypothetical protein [Azospirillum brasilense]